MSLSTDDSAQDQWVDDEETESEISSKVFETQAQIQSKKKKGKNNHRKNPYSISIQEINTNKYKQPKQTLNKH